MRRHASLGLLLLLGVTLHAVPGLACEAAPLQPESSVPTMDLHPAGVIHFSAPGPSAVTTLYALLQANPQADSQSDSETKSDPVYLLVKYKDDGRLDSYTTLGGVPGKRAQPASVAMFADGSSLVFGTTIEKTPEGTSLEVFSAIFDQSGAFRAPVTVLQLDTPAKEKHSTNTIALASSVHSVSSADGNIYVFEEDGRLDIVSPVGSVEHKFDLRPPADGLTGVHFAAADPGFLFVFYTHVATGEPGENSQYPGRISVVYPQSGEVPETTSAMDKHWGPAMGRYHSVIRYWGGYRSHLLSRC